MAVNKQRFGLGLGAGRPLQQSGLGGMVLRPSVQPQQAPEVQPPPEFMGKKGMELPVKTLGSIPSGVKGLGGLSAEEAVAKWEEMKKGMSEKEIKALGKPIDVKVYDTDLIGKSFGLNEKQIAQALTPDLSGDKSLRKKGLSDEQKIVRGLSSMLADERNLIDFEGNWDMFNIMNKMGLPDRVGGGGFGNRVASLKGRAGAQRHSTAYNTSLRMGTEMSEEDRLQMEAMEERIKQSHLKSQTFGELHHGRVKIDEAMLKKSAKDDDFFDVMGQVTPALLAIAATIATGGAGAAAIGALGTGTLGGTLAAGGIGMMGGGITSGLLSGGDPSAMLKGMAGGAIGGAFSGLGGLGSIGGSASQGIESARVGSEIGMTGQQAIQAGIESAGGYMGIAKQGIGLGTRMYQQSQNFISPGEMILQGGGMPQLFDPALAMSNYEHNKAVMENMAQQKLLSSQLQRSGSPLVSSKQIGGF